MPESLPHKLKQLQIPLRLISVWWNLRIQTTSSIFPDKLSKTQGNKIQIQIGDMCSEKYFEECNVLKRAILISKIAGPSVCEVYGFILDKRKTALPTCVQFDE